MSSERASKKRESTLLHKLAISIPAVMLLGGLFLGTGSAPANAADFADSSTPAPAQPTNWATARREAQRQGEQHPGRTGASNIRDPRARSAVLENYRATMRLANSRNDQEAMRASADVRRTKQTVASFASSFDPGCFAQCQAILNVCLITTPAFICDLQHGACLSGCLS